MESEGQQSRGWASGENPLSPEDTLRTGPCNALPTVAERLQSLPSNELRKRHHRLQQASRELGFHYGLAEDEAHREPALEPDLLPYSLPRSVWNELAAGVDQRMRAYNALLRDLYDEQNILKDRIIPHGIIFRDPAFLREIAHLPPTAVPPVFFGAIDCLPDAEGRWQVFEHHFSLPFGLAHLVQNRRTLTRVIPELFPAAGLEPVAPFLAEMIETMRNFSPVANPNVVLLTNNESREAFFEESFLARRMGIPAVKTGDLLVRDSSVYLRTVSGLEKVDVIYRRVRSSAVDPVAIASTSMDGIPGLLSCLRKGTVVILNGPGSGVADNRALLRYSDEIIRYYLGEFPILPSLPTFQGGDPDQADHIYRQRKKMRLDLIQSDALMQSYARDILNKNLSLDSETLLRTSPEWMVGRTIPPLAQTPRFNGKALVERPFFLRLFALDTQDSGTRVLPGALCLQQTGRSTRWNLSLNALTGSKDVWVEEVAGSGSGPRARRVRHRSPIPLRDYRLGSRAAESLYWMARYLERAENTARMLNILEEVRWDDLGRTGQALYWPLWRAVANATGQSKYARKKAPVSDTLPLSRALILDPEEGASVLSCLRSSLGNARQIRELLTPETWLVLNGLNHRITKAARQRKSIARDQLRQICQLVVDECAHFFGKADRTMPHDEGWHFFVIGTLLERISGVNQMLGQVLPHAARVYARETEENPDLTALLRILGSLDAYRREYRSRAYLDRVAELFWKSLDAPYSLAFGVRKLQEHTHKTLRRTQQKIRSEECLVLLNKWSAHLDDLAVAEMIPYQIGEPETAAEPTSEMLLPIVRHIEKECRYHEKQIGVLHQLFEDRFFHHQTMLRQQEHQARVRRPRSS